MLLLQRSWVPSLLGELRSYKPRSPKEKKKKKAKQCVLFIVVYLEPHIGVGIGLNAKETWETVNLLSSSYITIKFDFSCMRTCECFSVSKFLGVFFRILFRWIWRIWSIKISQVVLSNSYTSYFVKENEDCVYLDWSQSILLIKELGILLKY